MTVNQSKTVSNDETQDIELPSDFVCLNEWQDFVVPGQFIRGEYLGYETIQINEKAVQQYSVLNDEGVVTFNGTTQMLRLRSVPVGSLIYVLYEGEGVKSAMGNRIKLFKIGILKTEYEMLKQGTIEAAKHRMIEVKKMGNLVTVNTDIDPFADDEKYNSNELVRPV